MEITQITTNNKEKIKKDNPNIVIQYFSNETILYMLKKILGEDKYLKFINDNVQDDIYTNNKEEYLINTVVKESLLEMIKNYDTNIFDNMLQEMINIIY